MPSHDSRHDAYRPGPTGWLPSTNRYQRGGPPRVTPSRAWHPNEIFFAAEFRKNTGQVGEVVSFWGEKWVTPSVCLAALGDTSPSDVTDHYEKCTPRVHPLTEWTIPALAFQAEAGIHLLTREGWNAELAWVTGSKKHLQLTSTFQSRRPLCDAVFQKYSLCKCGNQRKHLNQTRLSSAATSNYTR